MQASEDSILILTISGITAMLLMAIAFILLQTRNQNRILRQRQKMNESELLHQEDLLSTVVRSQETERRRIGRDLHDDVGTALSNLRLNIEMLNHGQSTDVEKFSRNSKSIIDKHY